MSVYFKKGKGYRYDFTVNGQRYTKTWYKTKTKANAAEAERRKEVMEPPSQRETPTDMGFLELVNRRLDHVKAYNSERHYRDYVYMAKRWINLWSQCMCGAIRPELLQKFIQQRAKVSAHTANKEIRFLRATFNFGKNNKWISVNPMDGMDFFPVNKTLKYIPYAGDISRVVAQAESDEWLMTRYPDTCDYLETIQDTLGRMSEINRLEWKDVNFRERAVVLVHTQDRRRVDPEGNSHDEQVV